MIDPETEDDLGRALFVMLNELFDQQSDDSQGSLLSGDVEAFISWAYGEMRDDIIKVIMIAAREAWRVRRAEAAAADYPSGRAYLSCGHWADEHPSDHPEPCDPDGGYVL